MSSASRRGRASSLAAMPRALAAAALAAAALPGAAAAQPASVSAFTYVYKYKDALNQYSAYTLPGCAEFLSGAGPLTASVAACAVPANAGTGTAVAWGAARFDPSTGALKAGAAITADHYTLQQFVPELDADGHRVYTDAPRPDVVGVYSAVSLLDRFTFDPTLGAAPARLTLFFEWSGTLRADQQPADAPVVANSSISFCTAVAGVCGTPAAVGAAYYGGYGVTLRGDGANGLGGSVNAPPGTDPTTLDFAGSHTPTSLDGVLRIGDIPVSADDPFDFNLSLTALVGFYHPTTNLGSIPPGCVPGIDADCDAVDPVDVTGQVIADFTHSFTLAGYQVFDASGRDITATAGLTFASGLVPAPPVLATPEPASLALVGGGLGLLGVGARRRRSRRGDACSRFLT